MKMRKSVITLIVTLIIMIFAVPVHADTKVADWHTDQFKTMYAKIEDNDSWTRLDSDVRKQIENYARADRNQAESLLILRSIDMEVYSKKQKDNQEAAIVKFLNLLLSKEFQTHMLLTELAQYDGIKAQKDEKGIYKIVIVDIPSSK